MPLSCCRLQHDDEVFMHHISHTHCACHTHCTTNLWPASGVEDTGQASTTSQQQPSTVGGSMTSGEGTSLQSSPSLVAPARLGAALHRQRLASSQPEGSDESGSVSSNSSQLVPARFQAGQTASNDFYYLTLGVCMRFSGSDYNKASWHSSVRTARALESLQQRQLDLLNAPCRS